MSKIPTKTLKALVMGSIFIGALSGTASAKEPVSLKGTAADGIQKREHEVYHDNFAKASLESALHKKGLKLADYGNYTLKLFSEGENVFIELRSENTGADSPTLDIPYSFKVMKKKNVHGEDITITENMNSLLASLNHNGKLMDTIIKKTEFAGTDKFVDTYEFSAYGFEMKLLGMEFQANLNRYSKANNKRFMRYRIIDRDKDGVHALNDMRIDEIYFRRFMKKSNLAYNELRKDFRQKSYKIIQTNTEVLKIKRPDLYEKFRLSDDVLKKTSNYGLLTLAKSLEATLKGDFIPYKE